MFGDVLEDRQDEKTALNPKSPYAIAKVFGHYITQSYRESYNIFAVSGILFNHESPLRGEEFATRKIILGLVKILNNDLKCLELGNIYAKRDWGFAKEYVEAMWLMLQQKKPIDLIIGSGKMHSLREFVNEVFKILKLNRKNVIANTKKFNRKIDIKSYRANTYLANKKIGWKAKTSFKQIIKKMVYDELF